MSDIVPVDASLATQDGRRAALAQLNEAAEAAATPEDAHDIMLQGRVLSQLLAKMRAPYEEAWLAGKASVLAARRLGKMLADLSCTPTRVGRYGATPSERTLVARELGILSTKLSELVRLAAVDDPQFQRYIQSRDHIPSLSGALFACNVARRSKAQRQSNWRSRRRHAASVKTPANPSIDEAYSLIVKALGHLGSAKGLPSRKRSRAMEALYEAEDILKPYRGGYVKAA